MKEPHAQSVGSSGFYPCHGTAVPVSCLRGRLHLQWPRSGRSVEAGDLARRSGRGVGAAGEGHGLDAVQVLVAGRSGRVGAVRIEARIGRVRGNEQLLHGFLLELLIAWFGA